MESIKLMLESLKSYYGIIVHLAGILLVSEMLVTNFLNSFPRIMFIYAILSQQRIQEVMIFVMKISVQKENIGSVWKLTGVIRDPKC